MVKGTITQVGEHIVLVETEKPDGKPCTVRVEHRRRRELKNGRGGVRWLNRADGPYPRPGDTAALELKSSRLTTLDLNKPQECRWGIFLPRRGGHCH